MLRFVLKTQRGGRGWHDVGTVSAAGRQLRSALCVAPPPERRDLRSVSRLSMSWSHGAPLWLIWHTLPEGVLVDVGTFLRVACYLGSSGKMKGSVSSSVWPGKRLSYRLFKVLTVSTGAESGGTGGRVPCSWEISGRRPPEIMIFQQLFSWHMYFFWIIKHFQIKWPKSEEKRDFGGRWVWVPWICPPPQTKVRGGALDRKETTKVMSVITSSFIVMNIAMLFSLLSELSYV